MSPLSTSKVIPDGWAEHARPTIRGAMTATCTIAHTTGDVRAYNPVTGRTETTPTAPYYTGPCRVQAHSAGAAQTGLDVVEQAGYLVQIPLSADPAVGDVVAITAVDDNGDPSLVGKTLRVASAGRSSLAGATDLDCTDIIG